MAKEVWILPATDPGGDPCEVLVIGVRTGPKTLRLASTGEKLWRINAGRCATASGETFTTDDPQALE